jgi:hypothetical protein
LFFVRVLFSSFPDVCVYVCAFALRTFMVHLFGTAVKMQLSHAMLHPHSTALRCYLPRRTPS